VRKRRILEARLPRGSEATSLEIVEKVFPVLGSDEIAVRVGVTLIDPSSFLASTTAASPAASFAGVISELGAAVSEELRLEQTAIGVGPPADLISCPRSEVLALRSDSPLNLEQAAAIPHLCPFLRALRCLEIKPTERVLITGRAVMRHVSEEFLKVLFPDTSATQLDLTSGRDIRGELGSRFDVLVHEITDTASLQLSLSALGNNGRALLLVPPGRRLVTLDFYPHVHRSCLRLFARRVGSPCHAASCPDPGHAFLAQLLEQDRMDVTSVLSHASTSSQLAGLSLEDVNRSEKLLAINWP
jgi:hypothetical protein